MKGKPQRVYDVKEVDKECQSCPRLELRLAGNCWCNKRNYIVYPSSEGVVSETTDKKLCEVCRDREVFGSLKCKRCGKQLCGACASESKYTPILCPKCEDVKDVRVAILTITRSTDELSKTFEKMIGDRDDGFSDRV